MSVRATFSLDSAAMKPLIEEVDALVARVGTHPVWGHSHCVRVHALAEELAAEEDLSYDAEILKLSALLHDIGLYKAYAMRDAPNHARRSATVAERILRDGDFPPQASRTVMEAIEQHPPGTPLVTMAVEAKLLKDAIALDYLGVIGISRVLAMVGTEDDVPDIRAAIWHAESLRRQVPDLLLFPASQQTAQDRTAEMDDFFDSLRDSTQKLKLL